MIIDITPYEHYKEILIEKANMYDIDRAIQIAVLSFVPLIAVYTYLNEEYGGFDNKIESLTEFYQYTEIVREK